MRRLVTPTLQMTIGLLSMTLSLIFIALAFGLIPDENEAALEIRRKVSETLAVQLASLVGRNDVAALNETISSVTSRNDDVLSIAIRGTDGKAIAASSAHDAVWVAPADGKSTPTHVQIALQSRDGAVGAIEITFRPLDVQTSAFGLSRLTLVFVGFMCVAGFIGYYLILSRTLRELDPRRAVPERIKAAFDTLVEGVLILDESERVLLVNDAFASRIHNDSRCSIGAKASEFPWIHGAAGVPADLPWQTAMQTGKRVVGMPLAIRDASGVVHRLIVNATPILDGKAGARGVMATFDDVTLLHQKNEQLHNSIDELTRSQVRISEQNQQLQILASTDPLTKCLNRRTFFTKAEAALDDARRQRQPMSFLMLDVDHFKKINDRFGHAVGDKVLIGLVDVLQRSCRSHDLVGRYGGEEFSIGIPGLAEPAVEKLAEKIRLAVAGVKTWLPGGERVTISIGIASATADARQEMAEIVKLADEALYAAKKSGRNRFVNRKNMPDLGQLQEGDGAGKGAEADQKSTSAIPTMQRQLHAGEAKTRLEPSPQHDCAVQKHMDALVLNDRGDLRFAMALVDIDKFRHLNNFYGRDTGNELLSKIMSRIARRMRRRDMFVHYDGDEFLLLLDPFDDPVKSRSIIEQIQAELRRPIFIGGSEIACSCSIGVSQYPDHGRDFETLRRHADSALYRAKQSARGEAIFFDARMSEDIAARREAERRLRLAIRDGKLCCAFQPKVDVAARRVVGFEALVRWRGDDGIVHPPAEFIGLAVDLGLIGAITNVVRDIAIGAFDRLDAVFGPDTTLSINIASALANDVQFMMPFARSLRDSGRAERIVLELTEESFIESGAFQREIIPGLREIGVRVSIDDFGTGHSSLSMLAEITADEIKIDRSLICRIHERPRSQGILRAIGSIGQALNMIVVAEGVETLEELSYLQSIPSIRFVQGYYFSKPFYLEDLAEAGGLFAPGISDGRERRPDAPKAAIA